MNVKPLGMWAVVVVSLLAGCQMPTQQDKEALVAGFTAYRGRQYSEAQRAADQFIRQFPGDVHADEAYYLRGLSYLSQGERTLAVADFRTALGRTQRTDLKSRCYRALGDVAFESTEFAQARESYEQAMQQEAVASSLVHYRLGVCLQAAGLWDESRLHFQQCLSYVSDEFLRQRAIARMAAKEYVLQFGAYRIQNVAEAQMKALQSSGVGLRLVSQPRAGAPMYLLQMGHYATYAEAEMARNLLLPRYPLVVIVP